MGRDLAELRQALRDEAFHLRIVTRELRNRSKTLATVYDESLQRIEQLIVDIESPSQEAQGDRNGSTTLLEARQ